jgi:hypothetical protein
MNSASAPVDHGRGETMQRQRMLGGVIVGAASALLANALLFGSLFADGRTEVTMFILAGVALLFSIGSVALAAMVRPAAPILHPAADRHFSRVA